MQFILMIVLFGKSRQESCGVKLDLLRYYEALVTEYQSSDIMFIHAGHQSGEGMLPCGPFYHDEFAVANYKEKYGTEAYPDIATQETKDWLQESVIETLISGHKIINQHIRKCDLIYKL